MKAHIANLYHISIALLFASYVFVVIHNFSPNFFFVAEFILMVLFGTLRKICHICPTMIKIGTVIPYLKKIQKYIQIE